MNGEEYLRASGWESGEDDAGEVEWTHERRSSKQPGRLKRHTLAEAVYAQCAEDRARAAFVLARTEVKEREATRALVAFLDDLRAGRILFGKFFR